MDSHAKPTRRMIVLAPATSLLLALVVGCPTSGGNNGDPNQADGAVFPADYRSKYTLVRDCRPSIEHAATIRVWVNDVGAQAYLNDESPLPVGTIVVKEEFAGATCDNDAELFQWSVMRKDVAGFDRSGDNWRWQEVSAPDRTVRRNDKTTCIGCHDNDDCAVRDLMCTHP
jgi:hypothetical protein